MGEMRITVEEVDRVTWESPVQFLLTVLGFCVGLGNIWRFPYLCQQNGGGAFVLPFLVMVVVVGMPLLLLELGLGQKLRLGAAAAWPKVHPALAGVGYGSSVVAVLVGCYYNVIIAWCLYYLGSSFTAELPWSRCPLDYATGKNITECLESSETQYFWFRTTLDASDSIDDFGDLNWKILLTLTVAWVLVYLILMKGIASSGYVVYVTAIFPYIVLTIFFFRGLTLKGALAGLHHMFSPKLEMLLKPTVWLDAANQVFYSFGIAFGSMISFGSYNHPKKHCVRDVLIISAANSFTALYACAVIFSILGFKAVLLYDRCMEHDIGILRNYHSEFVGREIVDITQEEYERALTQELRNSHHWELKNCSLIQELDQAAQGTGLAFIVMAEVFVQIPGAPFWSVLFFLMLLSLGLGSQIGILEGVVSTLFDQPSLKHVKKPVLVAVVVVTSYLVGIVFTTSAGEYWLTLFDSFGATGLTFIAFTELICVMYVYGHKRFSDDIEEMTGYRPGLYWQVTWRFLSPALMAVIVASSSYFMFTHHPTYSAWDRAQAETVSRPYSDWSLGLAAVLAVSSLLPIAGAGLCWAVRGRRTGGEAGRYDSGGLFHRVDTTASTKPMLDNFENFDDIRSTSSDDSDSDRGIVVDEEDEDRQKNFKLEVLE